MAIRTLKKMAQNPQTFNEKVTYKMAFDRRDLLTEIADKVRVRDYVEARVGDKYLSKLFDIVDRLPSERPDYLPQNFAVKSTHGCGGSVFVWEKAPKIELPTDLKEIFWQRFLIHPENLEWEQLVALSDKWMKQSYYWGVGRFPEWAYKNIEPQIILEELHNNSEGALPNDLRFFMFDGKCELIMVDTPRILAPTKRDLYDSQWNRLDAEHRFERSEHGSPKPDELEEMLEVAEALSQGLDFVRVDLYATNKGIKFGELTSYPGAGNGEFRPHSFDTWLGSKWKLP
ncbi:MAG: ATP-grasp fold amidoligase family protein [Actinomycetota bacterium]